MWAKDTFLDGDCRRRGHGSRSYTARRGKNGVVYSMAYGDQPALICQLIDWARTNGFKVVAAGKGTNLPKYRRSTPDTWHVHYGFSAEDVARGRFNGRLFNWFLDGTKSAIEAGRRRQRLGARNPIEG